MEHTHSNTVQIEGTLSVGSTTGGSSWVYHYPHSHIHTCNHNLQYCAICDVVYCTICGKEWGTNYHWYPSWQPYGGTIAYTNCGLDPNVVSVY
jgi:hypothetical protein